MKRDAYIGLVQSSLERRLEIHRKKCHDYAGEEDVLANFKRLGEAVKTLRLPELWVKDPALGYALMMTMLKIDRIINLSLKDSKPENEGVQDSWDDCLNYLDLAQACYMDRDENKIE